MARPVSLSGKNLATAKAAFARVVKNAKAKGIAASTLALKAGYPRNAAFRWLADGFCSRFAATALGKMRLGATREQLRPDVTNWRELPDSLKLFRKAKPARKGKAARKSKGKAKPKAKAKPARKATAKPAKVKAKPARKATAKPTKARVRKPKAPRLDISPRPQPQPLAAESPASETAPAV